MKRYDFTIDRHQAEWIFEPIRNRRDVISLLMKTLKIMSVYSNPGENSARGTITLIVSKMSRLFYVSDEKIFSIGFPFFVQEIEGVLTFKSHSHSNIDSKASSAILSFLNSTNILDTSEVLHFADPISDACMRDAELWSLFRDLLTFEDGYIRYDYDPKHFHAHRHPLNHLDVFYTTNSTFKLGLHNEIDGNYFADILDLTTDCHFVRPIKG